MDVRNQFFRTILPLCAAVFIAACGGGDASPSPPAPPVSPAPTPVPPEPPGTLIGAAGGTVLGPNGASVVIPAGALTTDTRILIEQSAAGAPALPGGFSAGGLTFAFTPHGTVFALPVTVTLPFDPATVTAGTTPALYKTTALNQWEHLTNAVFGASTVSATVTSFSFLAPVVPPLVASRPVFEWDVFTLQGADLRYVRSVDGISVEGPLFEYYNLGPAARDGFVLAYDGELALGPDNIATAQLIASPDGRDWWVGTEAPLGIVRVAPEIVGSSVSYKQTQSFIKRSSDATLEFTLREAFLETSDANGILGRQCPTANTQPGSLVCNLINASIFFDFYAFTVPAAPFDDFSYFDSLHGNAAITGIAGSWASRAVTTVPSSRPLWTVENFAFSIETLETHEEALITMQLAQPRSFPVDLSSVAIGQAFTLQFEVRVSAHNLAAGSVNGEGAEFETSARAYLRDPLEIGGTSFAFSGLQPIETVLPVVRPAEVPAVPAPCVPGPAPNPASGVLQFSAPDYIQLESQLEPEVTVTRTGGATGAVTATFTTTDGTATAGTDYSSLNTTVYFADGDTTERAIPIALIEDALHSEPDRTVNLTLSQPGGCAALGPQSTAVLTIHDDDPPPPPALFTVGGTVIGLGANRLVLENHRGLFLDVDANGPFTFSSLPSPTGAGYFVRVFNQPRNALGFQTQQCTVTNGVGVFGNTDVTSVLVTCVDL